jgi:dienelactone hydrolase
VDRSAGAGGEPWWLFLAGTSRGDEQTWSVSAADLEFEAVVVPSGGPALVLLPHWEGTPRVARYVTRRFSRSGYQVFAILPPARARREEPSPAVLVQVLRDRIRTGRLAVRLAADRLRPSCIVLLGVSVGALAAVAVGALEPQVDGLIAALGGADLRLIASQSSDPLLRAIRTNGEKGSFELPPEELRRVDPLTWSAYLDPRRVLLLGARWDQVMPEGSKVALRKALRDPAEIEFPCGHFSFAAFLPFAVSASIDHADEVCRMSSP